MNILLVRMSCIGDILHATPVARALKNKYPHSHLVWIVTPDLSPLLKNNPYVDEILPWHRDDFETYARQGRLNILWRMWWPLRKQLQIYHFDLAIDIQGLLISGLVMLASGAKQKIGMGHTKELNRFFVGKKCQEPYIHIIERYLNVLHLLDIYDNNKDMVLNLSTEEKQWAQEVITNTILEHTKEPLIALVPGTSWKSKEWLPEYWQELANLLKVKYRLIYIGGTKELGVAERLPKGTQIYDAVGKTNLRETAALINDCQLLVSGDTGTLHMAAALNKSTISIFGPTNANVWGPLGTQHVKISDKTLTCLGCRKRQCPKQGHPCMKNITPQMIADIVTERINQDGKV